ncbi:MAG: tetratricopeptide repeat protein [Ignavibacteriaceae bacterium]
MSLNANAKNIKQMLQDILEKFLGEEEFSEIKNQLFAKSELPLNIEVSFSPVDKEQIEFEVDHSFNLGSQIDLLITLMELKLAPKEFYEFLLKLGQLSITSGELRLAADVHEKIIKQVENNSAYSEIAADAYLALGTIYRREARWDLSSEHTYKAKKLFEKLNNKNGLARCENSLGNIKGECGDLEGAKAHFQSSLSFLANEDDLELSALLETNLGIISNIQGLFNESLKYSNAALSKFEKLNNKRRIADVRHNIGMMYLQKNDYNSAVVEFNRSIEAGIEANNLPIIGASYLSKAYLYSKMQDHLLATAYADKALEICNKVNDKVSIAEIYKVKGIINKNLKNNSLSESYFLTSIRINRALNNQLNEAETSYELGLLYKQMKKDSEANKYFVSAKDYYVRIESKKEIEKIEKQLITT